MPSTLKESDAESPLAILGDEDVVSGFKALGFKVYALNPALSSRDNTLRKRGGEELQDIRMILQELIQNKCILCLVQHNFYSVAKEAVEDVKKVTGPVLIPFGKEGNLDLFDTILKDIRLKATGVF